MTAMRPPMNQKFITPHEETMTDTVQDIGARKMPGSAVFVVSWRLRRHDTQKMRLLRDAMKDTPRISDNDTRLSGVQTATTSWFSRISWGRFSRPCTRRSPSDTNHRAPPCSTGGSRPAPARCSSGCFKMAGNPSSSSLTSHVIPITKTDGTMGVISAVIWLIVATGLCFPWLVEEPEETKAGQTSKSVGWYVILTLDIVLAMGSLFSLWFRKSGLTFLLLTWGSACIVVTFVAGSFAMLPAVATMCCCAPEICAVGAADKSALDTDFCHIPMDLCTSTRWTLWCFYGGILLGMVAIVLLVDAVAFHHWVIMGCERQAREIAKAARASYRARRRRQEEWEDEVFNYAAAVASARSLGMNPPNPNDDNAALARQDRLDSLLVARAFRSPSPRSPPPPGATAATAVDAAASAEPVASSAAASAQAAHAPTATPAKADILPSAPTASIAGEDPEHGLSSPASATLSAGGDAGPNPSDDAFEATSGASGVSDSRTIQTTARACGSSIGRTFRFRMRGDTTSAGAAAQSSAGDEEEGEGRVSPSAGFRLKGGAPPRAIHN